MDILLTRCARVVVYGRRRKRPLDWAISKGHISMPRDVTAVLIVAVIAIVAVAIARKLPIVGAYVGGAAAA